MNEGRGVFIKEHKKIFIGVLSVLVAFSLFYLLSSDAKSCDNFECFKKSMNSCDKAKYISEETEASWKYEITGKKRDKCKINVKLLQAKEGELEINKIEGYEMICYVKKGSIEYPEKNLEECTGRLKEELQTISISKLGEYTLEQLI